MDNEAVAALTYSELVALEALLRTAIAALERDGGASVSLMLDDKAATLVVSLPTGAA